MSEENITLEEFAAINERRASAYEFMSRLYNKEVDQALLDEMHAMRFPVSTGDEVADEGNRLMAGYLSNIWDGTLQELAVDYVHAFIGAGMDAFSCAYPYESVYTSPKRLMMQEARDEVLAIYRSQGMDKDAGWKECEDHIAVEMEFMARLARRAAGFAREGDEAKLGSCLETQLNFLTDHLYAWSGMMTADMRVFARTDFYKGLASMTDGFLTSDVALLKDILGMEDEPAQGAGSEKTAGSEAVEGAEAGTAATE